MLGRIRGSSQRRQTDEPSIQGVGSLLGNEGVSLDGESVQLPDSEFADDVSSLNTSMYGGAGPGTTLKIVGPADEPVDSELMGGLDSASAQQRHGNDDDDDDEKGGAGWLPPWIAGAAPWLKGVIVLSTALLVGAIVLLAVAAGLAGGSSGSSSGPRGASSATNPGGTFSSTPAPAVSAPSLLQSAGPVLFSPSSGPSEPVPSMLPSQSPTYSPTFTGETRAPSSSPTTTPTATPSAQPTPRPTVTVTGQPTVNASTQSPTTAATQPPSSKPTPAPTPPPTFLPTTSPTKTLSAMPSVSPQPTDRGPTPHPSALPTASPSKAPTPAPTASPSTAPTPAPTVPPTGIPTRIPTAPPTFTATPPTTPTIVFYLVGGRARGPTITEFQNNLQRIPVEPDSFMIHLGDWNSPFATQCSEQSYQDVDALFSTSSVPVYFIPGDNEYNDCPDPAAAFDMWKTYLLDYSTKYWPPPRFPVQRQLPTYPENFSFVTRRILFIGIHLVGGLIHDPVEWAARQQANLQWIDEQFNAFRSISDMMVIFAHADPGLPSNDPFYLSFSLRVRNDYNIRTLLVHRNIFLENWGLETNFEGINNFDVLIVEGDVWPVMRVELAPTLDPFPFDQGTWFNNL